MNDQNKTINEFLKDDRKKTLKRYLPLILFTLFCFTAAIFYSIGSEEKIQGTLKAVSTSHSELGSKALLNVELEDGTVVLVPRSNDQLLIGKKVVIARKKTKLFGVYSYRFVSYINEK